MRTCPHRSGSGVACLLDLGPPPRDRWDMLDGLTGWPLRPVEDRRPEIGPWYVAGAAVLIVAEALLIVLLLLGRAGRVRARRDERRRFDTLQSQLSGEVFANAL